MSICSLITVQPLELLEKIQLTSLLWYRQAADTMRRLIVLHTISKVWLKGRLKLLSITCIGGPPIRRMHWRSYESVSASCRYRSTLFFGNFLLLLSLVSAGRRYSAIHVVVGVGKVFFIRRYTSDNRRQPYPFEKSGFTVLAYSHPR